MMRLVSMLCVAGLVVAAATSPSARVRQTGDQEVIEQVDALMKDAARSGFGGAVVIERKGRVLLSKGYGWANRQTRTAFTAETVAPISSITKSFTALALMQLAAQGKIDLQAPIKSYLTKAKEPPHRHGSATSWCITADWPITAATTSSDGQKAELIAVCTAQPLASTPGIYAYSNSGYSMLAAIVEEVSGQTWEDYLRAHVFAPAGMMRSG